MGLSASELAFFDGCSRVNRRECGPACIRGSFFSSESTVSIGFKAGSPAPNPWILECQAMKNGPFGFPENWFRRDRVVFLKHETRLPVRGRVGRDSPDEGPFAIVDEVERNARTASDLRIPDVHSSMTRLDDVLTRVFQHRGQES